MCIRDSFKDFNYWDPVIDSRMYMVEVGNGEGQIGAGGYYPSYEQYIILDFETGETVFTMDVSNKYGYNNMAIGMYTS